MARGICVRHPKLAVDTRPAFGGSLTVIASTLGGNAFNHSVTVETTIGESDPEMEQRKMYFVGEIRGFINEGTGLRMTNSKTPTMSAHIISSDEDPFESRNASSPPKTFGAQVDRGDDEMVPIEGRAGESDFMQFSVTRGTQEYSDLFSMFATYAGDHMRGLSAIQTKQLAKYCCEARVPANAFCSTFALFLSASRQIPQDDIIIMANQLARFSQSDVWFKNPGKSSTTTAYHVTFTPRQGEEVGSRPIDDPMQWYCVMRKLQSLFREANGLAPLPSTAVITVPESGMENSSDTFATEAADTNLGANQQFTEREEYEWASPPEFPDQSDRYAQIVKKHGLAYLAEPLTTQFVTGETQHLFRRILKLFNGSAMPSSKDGNRNFDPMGIHRVQHPVPVTQSPRTSVQQQHFHIAQGNTVLPTAKLESDVPFRPPTSFYPTTTLYPQVDAFVAPSATAGTPELPKQPPPNEYPEAEFIIQDQPVPTPFLGSTARTTNTMPLVKPTPGSMGSSDVTTEVPTFSAAKSFFQTTAPARTATPTAATQGSYRSSLPSGAAHVEKSFYGAPKSAFGYREPLVETSAVKTTDNPPERAYFEPRGSAAVSPPRARKEYTVIDMEEILSQQDQSNTNQFNPTSAKSSPQSRSTLPGTGAKQPHPLQSSGSFREKIAETAGRFESMRANTLPRYGTSTGAIPKTFRWQDGSNGAASPPTLRGAETVFRSPQAKGSGDLQSNANGDQRKTETTATDASHRPAQGTVTERQVGRQDQSAFSMRNRIGHTGTIHRAKPGRPALPNFAANATQNNALNRGASDAKTTGQTMTGTARGVNTHAPPQQASAYAGVTAQVGKEEDWMSFVGKPAQHSESSEAAGGSSTTVHYTERELYISGAPTQQPAQQFRASEGVNTQSGSSDNGGESVVYSQERIISSTPWASQPPPAPESPPPPPPPAPPLPQTAPPAANLSEEAAAKEKFLGRKQHQGTLGVVDFTPEKPVFIPLIPSPHQKVKGQVNTHRASFSAPAPEPPSRSAKPRSASDAGRSERPKKVFGSSGTEETRSSTTIRYPGLGGQSRITQTTTKSYHRSGSPGTPSYSSETRSETNKTTAPAWKQAGKPKQEEKAAWGSRLSTSKSTR